MKFDDLSIVIPCKNEVIGIQKIIDSVKDYSNDIIVVDGNSNDGTKEVCESNNIKFINEISNSGITGKGNAMRLGVNTSKNEYVLFFDADGSHNPDDISSIYNTIKKNNADLVITSRRTGGSLDLNNTFFGLIRSWGCDFLAYVINQKYKTNLSDVLYSFRIIKREVFLDLKLIENKFGIEQEMVQKCLKEGKNIVEIPSREFSRGWGKSKLRTISGIYFLFMLVKY